MKWLSAYSAVLRISGADANRYVQGQFSNEVRAGSRAVSYGLWLDHKGKVQADSHLLALGPEEFLVLSYRSEAGALKAHLERFIVADEVTVADETDRWVGAGQWGEGSAARARALGHEFPPVGNFSECGDARLFRGRRSRQENFEIAAPVGAELLRSWAAASNPDELELERIRSGIPAVPDDIGPADLPNEGGLEAEAISFTKGCFTGQEVMARLKNLGQVRRRLRVIRGPGAIPVRGAPLFQGTKKVGEVRTAAVEDGGFVAFAMISLLQLAPDAGLALAPDQAPVVEYLDHG